MEKEEELKRLELIAKSSPSSLENRNNKRFQELIDRRAERLNEFSKEEDLDVTKLTEKIKELNKGISNASNEEEIKRLGQLILKARVIKAMENNNKVFVRLNNNNNNNKPLTEIERDEVKRRFAITEKQQDNIISAKIESDKEKKRLAKIESDKEKKRLAKTERENEKKRLAKVELNKEKKRLAKIERENEKKRLAKVELNKEKKRLEKIEKENKIKNKMKKPLRIDLSQYMGEIDEEIIKDEKRKINLDKYFTDFD